MTAALITVVISIIVLIKDYLQGLNNEKKKKTYNKINFISYILIAVLLITAFSLEEKEKTSEKKEIDKNTHLNLEKHKITQDSITDLKSLLEIQKKSIRQLEKESIILKDKIIDLSNDNIQLYRKLDKSEKEIKRSITGDIDDFYISYSPIINREKGDSVCHRLYIFNNSYSPIYDVEIRYNDPYYQSKTVKGGLMSTDDLNSFKRKKLGNLTPSIMTDIGEISCLDKKDFIYYNFYIGTRHGIYRQELVIRKYSELPHSNVLKAVEHTLFGKFAYKFYKFDKKSNKWKLLKDSRNLKEFEDLNIAWMKID